MQINSVKKWDWLILQHLFISSFLIKMTVMTKRLYTFYYAWDGIMHKIK